MKDRLLRYDFVIISVLRKSDTSWGRIPLRFPKKSATTIRLWKRAPTTPVRTGAPASIMVIFANLAGSGGDRIARSVILLVILTVLILRNRFACDSRSHPTFAMAVIPDKAVN